MIEESLTSAPGIREQNLPIAGVSKRSKVRKLNR